MDAPYVVCSIQPTRNWIASLAIKCQQFVLKVSSLAPGPNPYSPRQCF